PEALPEALPEAEFVLASVESAFFGAPLPEPELADDGAASVTPVVEEPEDAAVSAAATAIDWTEVIACAVSDPAHDIDDSLAASPVPGVDAAFAAPEPAATPCVEDKLADTAGAAPALAPEPPLRVAASPEEMSVAVFASGHPVAWDDMFDYDPAEMFEPLYPRIDVAARPTMDRVDTHGDDRPVEPLDDASGAGEPRFIATAMAPSVAAREKETGPREQGEAEHARMREMAAPFVALPDYKPVNGKDPDQADGAAGSVDGPVDTAPAGATDAAAATAMARPDLGDAALEPEDFSFVALAGVAATISSAVTATSQPPVPMNADAVVAVAEPAPVQTGTAVPGDTETTIANEPATDQISSMNEEDGAGIAPIDSIGAHDVSAAPDARGATGARPAFFENGPAPAEGPFEIADVVARIDAFWRKQQDIVPEDRPRPQPASGFRFETDAKGVIRWVDGVSRAAVVGVSLELQGLPGSSRVDGVAAGAFRRRAGFSNARLLVEGDSDAAGAWLISAIPVFDPANGRFTGYRGTARRPRADERAEPLRTPPPTPADSLRQLVHELRTPTNAIAGFAEMIESQMLGPVSPPYRGRASVIRAQARDLLGAIDDLDLAARIESAALSLVPGRVVLRPVLAGIADDLAPLAELRGSWIALPVDDLAVTGDRRAVERLLARLLATLVSASAAGERIGIRTAVDSDDMVAISIERPAAFTDLTGDAMLAMDDEDGDATLLGTGFALRLARNLARELGGALLIDSESLTLRLPAAVTRPVEQAHKNG
ncbi:MAG: sensor histidine kinase, partial [Pseudomonadota bacterium]